MRRYLWSSVLPAVFVGCAAAGGGDANPGAARTASEAATTAAGLQTATFAGGCFWCMEAPFEKLDGVTAVIAGYSGGEADDPTYEQVSAGATGHAESVQIHFDPARISYDELLDVFWRQINPTDGGGQFVDRGAQYRSEIFYHDEAQRAAAERSRRALEESGRYDRPIVTPITPFGRFYPAEEYHQDFYKTHPERYHQYRDGSGRDRYLRAVWGDEPVRRPSTAGSGDRWTRPPDAELRARLTPLQYAVTQEAETEPPFDNEYWDNEAEGIYVDVASGEPLFASRDQYHSGTGWPSFTRPLVEGNITSTVDHVLFYPRTEVRSRIGNSHLGHVFDDGPPPTRKRYCINSAALRFVPKADLAAQGYGEFAALFED